MQMNNLRYTTVQNKRTNVEAIKLLEYPYEGIIYSYGKVELLEEGDHLRIKFEYDLIDDPYESDNNARPGFVVEDFEKYIGDILQELIHLGIEKNNITYTGGVDDENRTGDIIEPDSQ
jgi:hypothetical protein